jgi:hypothetical protein
MALQVFVALPVVVFASSRIGSDASNEATDVVRSWVAQCARVQAFECEWLETRDVIDSTGELAYSFDATETFEFRWPIGLVHRSRTVPTGDDRDAALGMRFNQDIVIGPNGVHMERAVGRGTERSLGDGSSLRKIVRSQAPYAPTLLGIWMSEQPETVANVDILADGSFGVLLPDQGMRVFLKRPWTRESEHASLVVYRLEMLSAESEPMLWWTYDDFVPIGNTGLHTGSVRVSYSILKNGTLFESAPATLTRIESVAFRAESSRPSEAVAGTEEPTPAAGPGNPDPTNTARRSGLVSIDGMIRALFWIGGLLLAAIVLVTGIGRVRSPR